MLTASRLTSNSVLPLGYWPLLLVSVDLWSFVAPNGTFALGPCFGLHCLLEGHFLLYVP